MTEDIARLPKWAQRKIESLEYQVESLKQLVTETNTSYEPTNVKLSRFSPNPSNFGNVDWGLPNNAQIDFYLRDTNRKWQDTVTVKHLRARPGYLDITSSGGSLLIIPAGGCNSIRLGISERY